jgi:serine protease Do
MRLKVLKKLIITALFGLHANLCFAQPVAPATFAPIVESAMPAVVNISTTQSVEVKSPLDDLRGEFPEGSPFFDQLFKELLEREFGFPEARKRKATSLGSGFIIHPDGFIVTNSHVIDGADEITVTLSNDPDKTLKAKVIGNDKKSDLAMLKIEANTALPYLKFGDADKARVGDWIIAIGNPFGLGGTVTAGIISAKSRLIASQYDELIQTDASINRGNSGGPMLNLAGEVIGVNTIIVSTTGGNIGIGFSIPSNQARPVIEQLKKSGKITRGWLGVGIQTLTDDIAKNIGASSVKGVLVTQVMKDSPAEKAGVKAGDIITSFDGITVTQPQKLSRVVAETAIGKKSNLEILRDGKPLKLTVTIELLNDKLEEIEAKKTKEKNPPSIDSTLGIKLNDITTSLREKFKLDPSVKGAIVSGVNRGSIAAEAGLLPGDVVMQVNRMKIENAAQAIKEIESAKKAGNKDIAFLINRAGSSRFITLELE